jgi:polysaccharide export outer membrane protein
MRAHRFALLATAVLAAASPGQAGPRPTPAFDQVGYAAWDDSEPEYRLYPGDEVEIIVPSAPELNRNAKVAPDGRLTLPLVSPFMAADRTLPDVEAALEQAYATSLRNPDVEIALKTATPLKVFVGGEVDKPGVYDMPGDIDAVQAVMMAGGFKTSARRREVIVIRRGLDGRPMMRTADLLQAVSAPGQADAVPLRRNDIIFVPRSTIANVGLFMQQYLRDALPVSLSFSYALNEQYRN